MKAKIIRRLFWRKCNAESSQVESGKYNPLGILTAEYWYLDKILLMS